MPEEISQDSILQEPDEKETNKVAASLAFATALQQQFLKEQSQSQPEDQETPQDTPDSQEQPQDEVEPQEEEKAPEKPKEEEPATEEDVEGIKEEIASLKEQIQEALKEDNKEENGGQS